MGPVVIGDNNRFEAYCAIGTPAEFKGRDSQGTVVIGHRNKINEFVTIHSALDPEEATVIRDDCYIMTKTHIGHDAVIENSVTLSSASIVGGHSVVMRGANIGLGAAIHQKRVVGPYCMVGMGSVVVKHLDPFVIAMGVPVRINRVNTVGLQRAGFTDPQIKRICQWFHEYLNITTAVGQQIWDEENKDDMVIKEILMEFARQANGIHI